MIQKTYDVFESNSCVSELGNLIISLKELSIKNAKITVGYPGLPNIRSLLKTGDAVLYETPDNGVFEIRLISIYAAYIKILVSHVFPKPGLTAGFVDNDPNNKPFSDEEKSRITASITIIKNKLTKTKSNITVEQLDLVLRKLDEISAATDRFNRKDWINWAIGTLTSLTVTAALSIEARRILFTSIDIALSWLFRNAIKLIQ